MYFLHIMSLWPSYLTSKRKTKKTYDRCNIWLVVGTTAHKHVAFNHVCQPKRLRYQKDQLTAKSISHIRECRGLFLLDIQLRFELMYSLLHQTLLHVFNVWKINMENYLVSLCTQIVPNSTNNLIKTKFGVLIFLF